MPHALLNHVALLAAGDGKFNPLDPNGAGNLIWTLLIFLLALPFMWKMVFGPISAALLERDARGGRNPRRVALLHGEAGGAAGAHNGRGATERRQ